LLARCSYMTVVPIRAVLAMCTALVLYGSPANLAWGNEENIDRPGSDFSNFDVVAPGGFIGPVDSCQISCERDGRCKAWTFVRAGIQGPKPRCWLKDARSPRPVRTIAVLQACLCGPWRRTWTDRVAITRISIYRRPTQISAKLPANKRGPPARHGRSYERASKGQRPGAG
jgi:hypothetical protein